MNRVAKRGGDLVKDAGSKMKSAGRATKKAGRNPQPPPRTVRPYSFAERDAIALELSAEYEPLPDFAAATGLRPE